MLLALQRGTMYNGLSPWMGPGHCREEPWGWKMPPHSMMGPRQTKLGKLSSSGTPSSGQARPSPAPPGAEGDY